MVSSYLAKCTAASSSLQTLSHRYIEVIVVKQPMNQVMSLPLTKLTGMKQILLKCYSQDLEV